MGNLCGKETSDPFAQPGRTLASAPVPQKTSAVPASRVVGGPARPLGGGGGGQTDSQKEDARRKAAEAAEARANASNNKTKGKLGAALQEQKKQSRTDTLESVSAEERARRQLKASEQQQRYD